MAGGKRPETRSVLLSQATVCDVVDQGFLIKWSDQKPRGVQKVASVRPVAPKYMERKQWSRLDEFELEIQMEMFGPSRIFCVLKPTPRSHCRAPLRLTLPPSHCNATTADRTVTPHC